jgi:hypothetical protein
MAFLAGLKIRELNDNYCAVTIRYKHLNTNPFKSLYFACLSMAAELSTGAIAMENIYKRKPAVSMLVTRIEGEFLKKAIGLITFTCSESKKISDTVDASIAENIGKTIEVISNGKDEAGDIVAVFKLTWSFKPKSV